MFFLRLWDVHAVICLIWYLSPAKGRGFLPRHNGVLLPCREMVTICFCHSSQSYSNDEHSPEPRDMLRSSPSRSHRHSVGFVPTVYNGTLPPSEFLRCLHKHTLTCHHHPPTTTTLPNMTVCLCSVRFSPPGSVSLPCCDGRDEESSVHRAQPPRSYQQLSICRLSDMSPAHSHQVTSFSHSCFKTGGLRQRFLNCRFSVSDGACYDD